MMDMLDKLRRRIEDIMPSVEEQRENDRVFWRARGIQDVLFIIAELDVEELEKLIKVGKKEKSC